MSRQATLEALVRVQENASYSNIVLDHIFSKKNLSAKDKSFASALFYGVIEKKLLLDYNISRLSDIRPDKISPEVWIILQMGLYQIFFMSSVPDAAAVNESVNLCKVNHHRSASGYVNGVLRAAAKLDAPMLPNIKKGKNKYYSVKYSTPEYLIQYWRQCYGDENTMSLLRSLDGRPPLCARVNTLKTTADELKKSFEKSGVTAEFSDTVENCLLLSKTDSVEKLRQYQDGLFHIQDTASQICCRLLSAKKGDTVLDVCAAPGGKSFTLAEYMENCGTIISCDLYDSRLSLIQNGAQRLGIDMIRTVACNSAEYDDFPLADRVLCDVPCSGLGIIRRKPELRYKENIGLDTLPEIQYAILCNCARFVKSGGLLLYSTCTLNPKENNENVRRFLLEHNDFEEYEIDTGNIQRCIEERKNELTLFPHKNHTDGFFISVLKRK